MGFAGFIMSTFDSFQSVSLYNQISNQSSRYFGYLWTPLPLSRSAHASDHYDTESVTNIFLVFWHPNWPSGIFKKNLVLLMDAMALVELMSL